MVENVYDPLERYRDDYLESFLKNAKAAFEELSQKAGVDREANKQLCLEIVTLSSSHEDIKSTIFKYSVFRIVCWVAVAVLFLVWACPEGNSVPGVIALVLSIAIAIWIFAKLNNKIAELRMDESLLDMQIQKKKDAAWEQMKPLNDLFDWDIPVKLIEKTVPKLQFDAFFTESRLQELQNEFGYDGSLNKKTSVLFSQSGQINGNPFVIADTKTFCMGEKTYTGYLTIHWTEIVEGFDGKSRRVFRSQTLSASITKPCPVYGKLSFVLYGNEAAPQLEFTRKPSGLTEEGFWQERRRKRKLRELKKFSGNLKDESQYTLMGNHEFETLFETKDRNDEVEYRLLFTPLAQRQMLSLIKDKRFGYGDDFSFFKEKKINVVVPGHLKDFELDTNPKQFFSYDFEQSKNEFVRISQGYFRRVYFALAPLLSIPLYQQMRTQKEIYKDSKKKSSFWEWESIANFYGIDRFKHPDCVTDCILKTDCLQESENGERRIQVSAFGYAGHPRVDFISVFGGDGRFHQVPVPWTEYTPVSRQSEMSIEERPELSRTIYRTEESLKKTGNAFRRGIFSR